MINSSRVHLDKFMRDAATSIPPQAKVLDAGAGIGPYRHHFNHTCYEAADFCQIDKDYAKVNYVCDLAAIPVPSDSCDAILLTQVIEHLPDPSSVLRELHRVLKPGGRMWFSGPLFYPEHEQPYDFHRFTQFGFRRLIEAAGFELEKLEWLEGYAGTVAFQLRLAREQLPISPSAYGGGLVGTSAAIGVAAMRPAFAILERLLSVADTRHKWTESGYCKNYCGVARKLSPTSARDGAREMRTPSEDTSISQAGLYCPCCDSYSQSFLPFGVIPRPNAMCPVCHSLERHRVLWLYLQDKTNLFRDKLHVLHFAPEEAFRRAIARLPNLQYVTADIEPGKAMLEIDITRIPFEDCTFDVILCNHVLEHVPEDRKAMSELYRVLSASGWAILQSPVDPTRDRTFEDPSITSPQDRERLFGQHDHVRVYGRDYKARLESAGFTVTVDDYSQKLGAARIIQCALGRDLDVYLCTKPGLTPTA
jgi:SAM-dependent methyltransferase